MKRAEISARFFCPTNLQGSNNDAIKDLKWILLTFLSIGKPILSTPMIGLW